MRSESSAYEACWYPTQGLGGEDTRSDEEHQSPPSPFFWRKVLHYSQGPRGVIPPSDDAEHNNQLQNRTPLCYI